MQNNIIQEDSHIVSNDTIAKILIIAGPTAVGKSEVSVRLAETLGAEIISADSMQIYRGLDIGTGKITVREMRGVTHHLIDIVNPDEPYAVGRYVVDAERTIADLKKREKPIIITGGTGLYLNALINGYNFAAIGSNEEVRTGLQVIMNQEGSEALYRILCERDIESARKISKNDTKRIIRALEILELSGEKKSERATQTKPNLDVKVLILSCEREELYKRIDARVEGMIENGLEKEVQGLLAYKYCGSMQAIGYKEFIEYFDGNLTFKDTVELIKKRSRNYAKRQMTYFRGLKAGKEFVDANDYTDIFNKAKEFLNGN